jgi:hypothetical protein
VDNQRYIAPRLSGPFDDKVELDFTKQRDTLLNEGYPLENILSLKNELLQIVCEPLHPQDCRVIFKNMKLVRKWLRTSSFPSPLTRKNTFGKICIHLRLGDSFKTIYSDMMLRVQRKAA